MIRNDKDSSERRRVKGLKAQWSRLLISRCFTNKTRGFGLRFKRPLWRVPFPSLSGEISRAVDSEPSMKPSQSIDSRSSLAAIISRPSDQWLGDSWLDVSWNLESPRLSVLLTLPPLLFQKKIRTAIFVTGRILVLDSIFHRISISFDSGYR